MNIVFVRRAVKVLSLLLGAIEFPLALLAFIAFIPQLLNKVKNNFSLETVKSGISEINLLLLNTALWGMLVGIFLYNVSQFIVNKYYPRASVSIHRPQIHLIFLAAQMLVELLGASMMVWLHINNLNTPLTSLAEQFGSGLFRISCLFAVLIGYPFIAVVGFFKVLFFVFLGSIEFEHKEFINHVRD